MACGKHAGMRKARRHALSLLLLKTYLQNRIDNCRCGYFICKHYLSGKFELLRFIFLITLLSAQVICAAQSQFHLASGRIDFKSEAPLELIAAGTSTFRAVVDVTKGEFAIIIPIRNFIGFNSPLQQEHFYENYMEIESFSDATFSGKILEPVQYSENPYTITLKGQLSIHGVKKQRIIEATCTWPDRATIMIVGAFQVPLADHNIEIPRVVFQKIAEVIDVNVTATLKPKP